MTTYAPPPSAPCPPEDDGGVVGRALSSWFGRNYRTSLSGLIAIAAVVAPFIPGVPREWTEGLHALAGVSMGAGLHFAKDKNVSGKAK